MAMMHLEVNELKLHTYVAVTPGESGLTITHVGPDAFNTGPVVPTQIACTKLYFWQKKQDMLYCH